MKKSPSLDLIGLEASLQRALDNLTQCNPKSWDSKSVGNYWPRMTDLMTQLNELEFEVINMRGLIHNKIVETDT